MSKPEFELAYLVAQSQDITNLRATDAQIDTAIKDFVQMAKNGYLTDIDKWPQHVTVQVSVTSTAFGKVGPFFIPKEASKEPILHLHVMPLNYVAGKHEHHSTSDASIVYADFKCHDKRIIYIIDFGSSHNGNMTSQDVEEYIAQYYEFRHKAVAEVKRRLGLD
ncbi:hypothetical protein [Ewingella americana]|uniref:Uncharacterized protein n=1 Tax=Ewingella americana TaxID=41202 RepID=A0A502GGS9_9GAMM|nr:hypothetical protein [Ewingella americana]TPG59933.1 hypothetical protein EAH77_15310 [Ewingella americana]